MALCALLEYLFHWLVVPALFVTLCLWLLACRLGRWVMRHPALHRFAAACVLLVCRPRPIDGKLYDFVNPKNA
jgi:hypothetical protein